MRSLCSDPQIGKNLNCKKKLLPDHHWCPRRGSNFTLTNIWKVFKNIPFNNNIATVYGITMQASSKSVHSKLLKPTPDQYWGPGKGFKV